MSSPFAGGSSSSTSSAQTVTTYLNQEVLQAQAVLTPPQGGLFGVLDFTRRLIAKFPAPWTSDAAKTYGNMPLTNGLFAAVMTGAAWGLAILWQMAVYCLAQTRLVTATDVNLDLAYFDFFANFLPRYSGEPDDSFRTRLRQFFIIDRSSLATITAIVEQYFAAYAPVVPDQTILALDVPEAGLDTGLGGLDESFNIELITVYVFDQQSDPVNAARYGIAPPQFCILLTYPKSDYNWYWDTSFWDNDFWVSGNFSKLTTPPFPALDVLIEQLKAIGTQQVYVSNIAS